MSSVIVTVKGAVGLITLNRIEKRNALNSELMTALMQALIRFADDQSIQVVILNANGSDFCAGADIDNMRNFSSSSLNDNLKDANFFADFLFKFYTFPKPLIMLVQGRALGGALGMLACADIVIAADDAKFGFSEVKLGLTPSTISPYIINIIGERNARYYFMTAQQFDVTIAKQLNLVQEITPTTNLLEAGFKLSEKLLMNSPNALKEVKKLLHMVSKEKMSVQLSKMTAEHLANVRMTDDAKEGLQAFLEKRPAQWGL